MSIFIGDIEIRDSFGGPRFSFTHLLLSISRSHVPRGACFPRVRYLPSATIPRLTRSLCNGIHQNQPFSGTKATTLHPHQRPLPDSPRSRPKQRLVKVRITLTPSVPCCAEGFFACRPNDGSVVIIFSAIFGNGFHANNFILIPNRSFTVISSMIAPFSRALFRSIGSKSARITCQV